MKYCIRYFFSLAASFILLGQASAQWVEGNDARLQYTGRVQQLDAATRLWMPGTYVRFVFKADTLKIALRDQMQYGVQLNYVAVQIDDKPPLRVRLKGFRDTLIIPVNDNKTHTAILCKDTESSIGYLDVRGVMVRELHPPSPRKKTLIAFFGDSITCGASSDTSLVSCGGGRWEDQHNAYFAYGPVLARKLSADWILNAVSGIGLMRSCCEIKVTLPQVFDKVVMHRDSITWDSRQRPPDIAVVCLGQNDGIQDSFLFQTAYIDFLEQMRERYPNTTFVLISSPMADAALRGFLQDQLIGIRKAMRKSGDQRVLTYFFKKEYNKGCDYHPNVAEHGAIANELVAFFKTEKLLND